MTQGGPAMTSGALTFKPKKSDKREKKKLVDVPSSVASKTNLHFKCLNLEIML